MNNVTRQGVLMKRMIVPGLLTIAMLALLSIRSRTEIYIGTRSKASVPLENVDHSTWNRLVQKYVDDDGLVAYREWHTNQKDQQALEEYLNHLSSAVFGSSNTKPARLAFWINTYNALTVYGILREYPTSSIRNHTSKLGGYNIWEHLQLYVDGTPYSLNDIAHEILRKMQEPRIHFAIVCASISCPRLLNEAYVPERLEEQLETNASDFFSRRRNFQYDSGRMKLSSILKWFGKDFGPTQKEQLRAIAQWLPSVEAQIAAKSEQVSVSYLSYDWGLNER